MTTLECAKTILAEKKNEPRHFSANAKEALKRGYRFEKAGLSLHELGWKVGFQSETVHQSVWQFMKAGGPRISVMHRFAEAMGMKVKDLL